MPRSKSLFTRTGDASSGGSSSGLFTGVGAQLVGGTINTCPADNVSMFCQISRAFQIFAWIVSIVLIIVVVWLLVSTFLPKSKGGFFKKIFKWRG